jgi:hypothetical protein
MILSFDYVTPHTENRKCYSFTYASILRDSGSVFDSTVRELIQKSREAYSLDIGGFLKFIYEINDEIKRYYVHVKTVGKGLDPLKRESSGIPEWWHAYNKVKHNESINYKEGNFENAMNGLASLALLHTLICSENKTKGIFSVAKLLEGESLDKSDVLFP